MAAAPALLSCKGATRNFGGVVALDRFDLEVERGQIIGLIGPNGSGKTTFFNVLTGIYDFSAGQAQFDGQPINGLSAQEVYRAGITRTFQRSRMCLPLSIFDNIMVGNQKRLNYGLSFNLLRRRAFRRQFEENVERAHALVKVFDPPLADQLFEPVGRFRMLDRRRIEICRALISEPKMVLLDEPSAGMTPEETRQLMDDILLVRSRDPQLSVIIIEHEMSAIERVSDHCVVLSFGKKICEGTYREVANDPQVQEAYLGAE